MGGNILLQHVSRLRKQFRTGRDDSEMYISGSALFLHGEQFSCKTSLGSRKANMLPKHALRLNFSTKQEESSPKFTYHSKYSHLCRHMKLPSDGCCGCGKNTACKRGCQLQQLGVSISLLRGTLESEDIFEQVQSYCTSDMY